MMLAEIFKVVLVVVVEQVAETVIDVLTED